MGKARRWIPLESNPEVMNAFSQKLGLPSSVGFFDVYGLDEELLSMVPQPVYALIFLFIIDDEVEEASKEDVKKIERDGQHISKNVYFMKQTISNACGTIALLHSVFNNLTNIHPLENSYLDRVFKSTKSLNPMDRALFLENDDELENAHSDAALTGDSDVPRESQCVDLHFVSFVCVDGELYELDGRKPFAINHGKTSPETLLQDSIKVVQSFVQRKPDSLQYNLISLSAQ